MAPLQLVTSDSVTLDRNEASMRAELDRILRQQLLSPLFMPIVNSRERSILGYEALIRGPESSPLHSPINLFKTAHNCSRLLELELLCRELSVRRFKTLGLQGKLFLNVSPATLLEPDFKSGMTLQLMNKIGFDTDRIVIEITEQFPIEDYTLMKEATQHYRELGFQVALDDLGAGYAGLRSWSELRPQYVKIDRHFIESIDEAPIKQEFVRSILEVARSIQCKVIAEGIERIEEHRLLNALGLDLQQGYYFSRPSSLPPKQLDSQLFRFDSGEPKDSPGARQELTAITQIRPAITLTTPMVSAARIFRKNPGINSLAVTDQELPVGMLNRETFLRLYLNPFGRELHDRKPVSEFMDRNPLVLEECTALSEVSNQISQSDPDAVRSDFIVTNKGKYLGTGSVFDLLRLVTDLQLKNARHANPLTLLPGSVPANEEIERRLVRQEPFAACYFDIDHFKAFNDRYGYERGDQMIKKLAGCLKTLRDDRKDFISHIGGDDFIVLFGSADWELRCQRIMDEFSAQALDLYNDEERNQGGILGLTRNGDKAFHPLATLSVGVTLPDLQRHQSHHDIARLASAAKSMAKQHNGNSLFINRRKLPDRFENQVLK
jgi:EAL domain-containing protein (putative c-di-GMP-specific phosphodiesterase class I)/GGDEF domain-containing protein